MRILALIGVLAACEPSARETPRPAGASNLLVANDLSLIATGVPATPADLAAIEKAGGTREAYDAYIDQLVARPGFSNVMYGALRLRARYVRFDWTMGALKSQMIDGKPIFYLHEPCTADQAQKVHPWWAIDTEVSVCPAAYRPDVFQSDKGDYCSGFIANPGVNASCGCGPNLIRCYVDDGLKKLMAAAYAESTDTLNYVVTKELPIQTLFRGKETFRSGAAELIYQRWFIENRLAPSLEKFPDWRKWPAEGQWAPRPEMRPHQHAGLLTSQSMLYPDSSRNRLDNIYSVLWCQAAPQQLVEADTLMHIADSFPTKDLRKTGSNDILAKTPPCTACHARLESGGKFFAGAQWAFHIDHYVAAAQLDTEGTLYKTDIDDPRGKAPMNPEGFAKLALAQPEFAQCMADRVIEAVFGTDASQHPEVRTSLAAIVQREGTFRELGRVALRQYAADRLSNLQMRPPRSTKLAALADTYCADCHDAKDERGPRDVIAKGDGWCAKTPDCARKSLQMMDVLTFKVMPKFTSMPIEDRLAMVEALAPSAFPDAKQRASALAYFRGQLIAPPVHALPTVLARIHAQGSTQLPKPNPPFKFTTPYFTTRFDTTTTVRSALAVGAACKGAADRKACVEQAYADPGMFFK